MEDIMKVSKVTDVRKLASAIVQKWDSDGDVRLSCIGAAAVNQAVKAVGRANSQFDSRGQEISFVPSFRIVTVDRDNSERTAIILIARVHDK